jgi:hypothetical protein
MFVDINNTIPYHQGAINYYKKKNRWNSDQEKRNQLLLSGEN